MKAFPVMDTSQNSASGETIVHQCMESGMDLRDYFAAKAMPIFVDPTGSRMIWEADARCCYEMADAMLKARNA